MRLLALAAGLSSTGSLAQEPSLAGLWVIQDILQVNVVGEFGGRDGLTVVRVQHDVATGALTTTIVELSDALIERGFRARDPAFDGTLLGGIATGQLSYDWQRWGGTDAVRALCPALAPTQVESEIRVLEDGARLEWTLPVLSVDLAVCRADVMPLTAGRNVWNLAPFFVVRELRFVAEASAGGPYARLDYSVPGQTFRLEAEFEIAPPAAIDAALVTALGPISITLFPTAQEGVFRSGPYLVGRVGPIPVAP
ncbi:MAG: hypothetical protein KIT43_01835 [Bauldia sp.]|nr:hypothetical protein [Bauldia sp.]